MTNRNRPAPVMATRNFLPSEDVTRRSSMFMGAPKLLMKDGVEYQKYFCGAVRRPAPNSGSDRGPNGRRLRRLDHVFGRSEACGNGESRSCVVLSRDGRDD